MVSLLGPVDGRIHGTEPGESEDNVFSAVAHDIEEMFLGNSFNVCIEGTSIADCTSFVHSLVDIVNSDGGGKFLSGELVFSDKLPIDAGDVCTRIY